MKIRKVCLAVMMGAFLLAGCGDAIETVKEEAAAPATEEESVVVKSPVVSDEEFFKKLYDTMSSDLFFELMVEFINTQDVETIVAGLNGEACIYSSDAGFVADYTGTAVGIYPYGDGEYYFYFGEYVDGSREGKTNISMPLMSLFMYLKVTGKMINLMAREVCHSTLAGKTVPMPKLI